MNKYGMLIDYCTGCHTCGVACQQEKRVRGRRAGGSLIFLAYTYGSPNWTLF